MEVLPGGVSSDIWRVDLPGKRICVKRALPRLRVAQVWEAPIERNRYERQWLQTAAHAVHGCAPKVLAWDDAAGLFAMEYLEFPVWKNLLREGKAHAAFAAKVGSALAAIHAATAGKPEVEQAFPTDAIFHAIRLEPYLVASAARHADLADVLQRLVQRTAASKHCLVHGDVSPKNILVAGHGPVFLDAECAWYGDPAFDLAFCLNHMFLKSVWVPQARAGFLECFGSLPPRSRSAQRRCYRASCSGASTASRRWSTWTPPASPSCGMLRANCSSAASARCLVCITHGSNTRRSRPPRVGLARPADGGSRGDGRPRHDAPRHRPRHRAHRRFDRLARGEIARCVRRREERQHAHPQRAARA